MAAAGIADKAANTARRAALAEHSKPGGTSKQEHSLFSVMGDKRAGPAMALVIAATEADPEYYALNELGFVTVSATILVSDSVHVGPADTKE